MTPTYQSGFYAPGRGVPKYPELWKGCVGAWSPSLGQSGLVLRDWSGFGNHGTLTNGPTWVPSRGQYALECVTNDYIACPAPAVTGNKWTVAMWAFYRSTGTSQAFWTQYTSGTAGRSFLVVNYNKTIGNVSANELAFGVVDALNNAVGTGTASLTVNKWYHIAVRAAETEISLWVNGVQTASTPYAISIESAPIVFGRLGNLATFYLDGGIDDIMSYRTAISAKVIQMLASRRGIAYELAPRKVYSIPAAVGTRQYKLLRPSILRGA